MPVVKSLRKFSTRKISRDFFSGTNIFSTLYSKKLTETKAKNLTTIFVQSLNSNVRDTKIEANKLAVTTDGVGFTY